MTIMPFVVCFGAFKFIALFFVQIDRLIMLDWLRKCKLVFHEMVRKWFVGNALGAPGLAGSGSCPSRDRAPCRVSPSRWLATDLMPLRDITPSGPGSSAHVVRCALRLPNAIECSRAGLGSAFPGALRPPACSPRSGAGSFPDLAPP